MSITPQCGHVYHMYDEEYGTLHCLVISTVPSSDSEGNCIAVRVMVTATRYSFPYWVRLNSGDPTCGYVVVHDFGRVDHDELKEDLGELSTETMVQVNQMLKRMMKL